MAVETAVGPISAVEDLLANTIANATYFLTFAGEATVNDALGRIYFDALPEPSGGAETHTRAELEAYRPFVIVYSSPVDTIRFQRQATGNHYIAGGTLFARIERDAPSGENLEGSERSWKNVLGKLLKQTTESDPFDGVLDMADTAGRLTINRCQVNAIGRADDNEVQSLGDYQLALVQFDWGPLQ